MVTRVLGSTSEGLTQYVGSVAEGVNGLTLVDGQAYNITGWHSGETYGGGLYRASTSAAKSLHDGGKYISPTVPPVSAQAGATLQDRIANFNAGEGETDVGGTGILVNTSVEFKPENYGVFIYDTIADAVAGNESSGAFMDAVAASRGTDVLYFPHKKFINVGAGVLTQSDGFYKSTYWQANFCTLVRTEVGTTLKVLGGASYQTIYDIQTTVSSALEPSSFDAVYDDALKTITPNAEHTGIFINGARTDIRATSSGNKGFDFHIVSNSGNSNACTYDLVASGSGACGVYVEGTQDDLSVSRFRYRGRSSYGPLFWVTDSAALRQWDAHIYVEKGLLDQSTPELLPTQCFLGGASNSKFWIYSECTAQTNQEAEVLTSTATSGCEIRSVRANRDKEVNIAANTWLSAEGNPIRPFSSRSGPVYSFQSKAARIGTAGEDMWLDLIGNNGKFGSIYGGDTGIGFSKSNDDGTATDFKAEQWQRGEVKRHSGGTYVLGLGITKGSVDAPTGFVANEPTHYLNFQPYNGTSYDLTAGIVAKSTYSDPDDMGGEIAFRVKRADSKIMDETFLIERDGNIETLKPNKGIIIRSPNNTRWLVRVDDTGALFTTAI